MPVEPDILSMSYIAHPCSDATKRFCFPLSANLLTSGEEEHCNRQKRAMIVEEQRTKKIRGSASAKAVFGNAFLAWQAHSSAADDLEPDASRTCFDFARRSPTRA